MRCTLRPPFCTLHSQGDTACGRPFHLGSTLNTHFHDCAAMVRSVDWSEYGAVNAFKAYEEKFRLKFNR